MSSCGIVCGTGGWTGPKPGDPDNYSVLTAVSAMGGIDLSWSMPSVNPFAVSYTEVFRGGTDDKNAAIPLVTAGGGTYFDRITVTEPTTYYYWIRFVSVNATFGEWIGPASAVARPITDEVLDAINGKIDDGALAQALKTEIARISLNYQAILDEVDARINGNTALADALVLIDSRTDTLGTFINDEITERIEGDEAMANTIALIAAANEDNRALILEERTARVTADEAFTQIQTTMDSQVNHPVTGLAATRGTLILDYYTKADADSAIAASTLTLSSQVNNPVTGLAATRAVLLNDYYTKADTEGAVSKATTGLVSQTGLNGRLNEYTTTAALQNTYYTKTDTNTAIATATLNLASKTELGKYAISADIQRDYYTKTDTQTAIAEAATTVQVTDGKGNTASLQQALLAQVTLNNGLTALYTMKLSNDGLIGGMGMYNDGITVEAGFDVDKFWLGRTNSNKIKPFVMIGDTVYIDKARIRDADIGTLKIAGGAVTSSNYNSGGASNVSAGSSTILTEVWVNMGTSVTVDSGVVVVGGFRFTPVADASMHGSLYRISDGALIGFADISGPSGFTTGVTVTGFDRNPVVGNNGYRLVATNPAGGPGANVGSEIKGSSIIATGGKR